MKTHEYKAALNVLRSAGYVIVAWTPEEMERMSDEARETLCETLVEHGEELIEELQDDEDDEDDEDDDHCTTCDGTGEGMYDGTSCSSCRGRGVIQREKEYDDA